MRVGAAAVVAAFLGAMAMAQQGNEPRERPVQPGQQGREQTDPAQREQMPREREQVPGQQQREQGRDPSDVSGRVTKADQQIASMLAVDNWKEIQLSEFGSQRAQNPEVKQFAQQMIQDHSAMIKDLQKFSKSDIERQMSHSAERQPGALGEGSAARTGEREMRGAEGAQASPVGQRGAGAARGGELDFLEIKRQVAEQCVQSAKQDLQQKSQAEFDKCFMGMQVMAHSGMVDVLNVLQDYASPELRPVLDEATQKTRQHLDEARSILEKIDNNTQRSGRGAGSQ